MKAHLIPLLLIGCAAGGRAGESDFGNDSAPMPGELTINVYPGSATGLLPQTFRVRPSGEGYADQALLLTESVTVSGVLTGVSVQAWSAVGAPTSRTPFSGTVEIALSGTVQTAAARVDADGYFSLSVPSDGGYEVAFRPDHPTSVPTVAVNGRAIRQDLDLSGDVGPGVALFGRVTAGDAGVASAPLILHREGPEPAVSSVIFETDDAGWYAARVPTAGSYRLEVQGGLSGAGVMLPSVGDSVVVDDVGGTLNLDLGTLSAGVVAGTVVDTAGDPVPDAKVTLSSLSLDGAAGWLSTDATTDSNGNFVARVVAGSYEVQIVPPYAQALSPLELTIAASGSLDLGLLQLGGVQDVLGVVNFPSGEPAQGVTVTATQQGWGGYAWTTTTDVDGRYVLPLPLTDSELWCAPPATSGAAGTRVDLPLGGDPSVMLLEGQLLSGSLAGPEGLLPYALVEVVDATNGALLGNVFADGEGGFQLSVAPSMVSPDTGGPLEADTGDTGDTGTPADTGDSGDSGRSEETGETG